MALISRNSGSGTSSKKSVAMDSGVVSKKPTSITDKRRKRTLAKQQQISENVAHLSEELLAKTQEGVSAIEELKSAMEQIAAASEENAGAAEESLSAVAQIRKNTEFIFKESNLVLTNVLNASNTYQVTNNSMVSTSKRMDDARVTANGIVTKTDSLKKAGDNIGETVTVIAKVADQTNLLALNAAIEAARAKEHGKGFAVVADETRGLAAISSQNAEETSKVVENIQTSIKKSKESVERTSGLVNEAGEESLKIANNTQSGVEYSKKLTVVMTETNQGMQDVMDAIERLEKGSERISAAAEEQASAVNQATSSVEMQASALAESEQAASNIAEIAEELKNSTDVDKDAQELASAAEELSSAVEEIQRSMVEVTNALGQIEKAAELSNGDATENATIAQQSMDKVKDVSEKVDNAISYLKEILKITTEIKEFFKFVIDKSNLSLKEGKNATLMFAEVMKYSKTISKILRTIENVVTQTTMLAVSGSIEAARAGEFGKGFAVVSSDIRNLAQDAQGNLEKIFDVMTVLDEEIDSIISEWDVIMRKQEQEVKDLTGLENDIDNVLTEIKKLEDILNGLQSAIHQNRDALEEAVQGSEQIQQAAELATSNASQSKEAAELILSTIEDMGNVVEELAVLADELQQG